MLFVLICVRMTGSHFPVPSVFVHWLPPNEPQLVTVVLICTAAFDEGVAAVNVTPKSARVTDKTNLFIHLSCKDRIRGDLCDDRRWRDRAWRDTQDCQSATCVGFQPIRCCARMGKTSAGRRAAARVRRNPAQRQRLSTRATVAAIGR